MNISSVIVITNHLNIYSSIFHIAWFFLMWDDPSKILTLCVLVLCVCAFFVSFSVSSVWRIPFQPWNLFYVHKISTTSSHTSHTEIMCRVHSIVIKLSLAPWHDTLIVNTTPARWSSSFQLSVFWRLLVGLDTQTNEKKHTHKLKEIQSILPHKKIHSVGIILAWESIT